MLRYETYEEAQAAAIELVLVDGTQEFWQIYRTILEVSSYRLSNGYLEDLIPQMTKYHIHWSSMEETLF